MNLLLLLIILLVLFGGGSLPAWEYSRNWGYGPSGLIGLLVIVLLVWLIMGRR